MDQVKELFKALRKKGFVARMNFACCGSCAVYELNETGKKAPYAVFSRQSRNDFWDRGLLYVNYGQLNKDENADEDALTVAVGQIILETANEIGIPVVWDGNYFSAIGLVNVDHRASESLLQLVAEKALERTSYTPETAHEQAL
jgi:hypothetical protein